MNVYTTWYIDKVNDKNVAYGPYRTYEEVKGYFDSIDANGKYRIVKVTSETVEEKVVND